MTTPNHALRRGSSFTANTDYHVLPGTWVPWHSVHTVDPTHFPTKLFPILRLPRTGAPMHCHFHLLSANEFFPDETGIEVTDFSDAWAQAAQAVREFCDEMDGEDCDGWSLRVCDGSGNLLFSMPITTQAPLRLAA